MAEDEHGTRAAYRRGCRCESCSGANAAYSAGYRAQMRRDRLARRAAQEAAIRAGLVEQRLTVEGAAGAAGVSADTIERARARGDLPASRPPGTRQWLIRASDLDRWLDGGHPAAGAG